MSNECSVLVLEFVTARTVLNSQLQVASSTISGENTEISLKLTRASAVVSAANTQQTTDHLQKLPDQDHSTTS